MANQDKYFLVENQEIEFDIKKFRGRSTVYDIAANITGPDQAELQFHPEEAQLYRKGGL